MKPHKYTDEHYTDCRRLFAAHDAETPAQFARESYDRTRCGVWTEFILRGTDPSGAESVCADDMDATQNTLAWLEPRCVGVRFGTIVEGSDAEYQADPIFFPIDDREIAEAWDYLEELVEQTE
jgi:hypothetical protein|tara:strand:- start:50 stop:418 length:369 start_codon:yes stop_codon:yes gene_type:complete